MVAPAAVAMRLEDGVAPPPLACLKADPYRTLASAWLDYLPICSGPVPVADEPTAVGSGVTAIALGATRTSR